MSQRALFSNHVNYVYQNSKSIIKDDANFWNSTTPHIHMKGSHVRAKLLLPMTSQKKIPIMFLSPSNDEATKTIGMALLLLSFESQNI